MILEEIEGSVRIMYAGRALSIGDSADDYSKSVSVVGAGKAIFRIDPNATFEVKGVEAESYAEAAPIPAPAPAPAPTPKPAPTPVAPVNPEAPTAE